MDIDIEKSLTYFKKDFNCSKVYWSLVKISFLALIPFIGAIFVTIFYCGYAFSLTNSKIFKPNASMPEWNVSKIFGVGIKYVLFSLLISAIFFPISLILNLATKNISENPLILIISIVLYILYIIFLDLAVLLYATNLKFNSFFKFSAMKHILINNFPNYVAFLIIRFLITLGCVAIIGLSLITIIGPIFLIPFLTFIIADLNAQFIRQTFKITSQEAKG